MEQRQLEKIARMVLYSVPQVQIAAAFNVSESRVSQILETKEYKLVQEKIATEQYEEEQLVNQGWDAVEQLSLNKVINVLQHDPDPDFALKAAVVANKAVRRGNQHTNKPIAATAGMRAVITLRPVFVDKLQQNFEISENRIKSLEKNKKDSNFLSADKVQEMLSKDIKTGQSLEVSVETPVTTTETTEDSVMADLKTFEITHL